ncbi:MAG: tetratricopeptide repeat protein [Sphingobacteriales bacterium]|nr:tetratricopeptide repeat protein [Sphingobacteriales bacterium]
MKKYFLLPVFILAAWSAFAINQDRQMRKTDKAKACFTKVYELDPSNPVAIKELANLYYSYRQFAKAIEFASKCKNYENAERIIAMSSYQLEDYTAAIPVFQRILAKNPNDIEITYAMARAYLDMEEYSKSIPLYQKAIQLDPTKNLWMYELGLIYYNGNNFKNALAMFLKAEDNGYPQTSDFNENLGYAYIYAGDFDRGEKLLLAIIAQKPGNKNMLRDMAEAYYTRKMYDKSLEFCQKLMEMDTQDAKALYQAGLCFQKKGDKNKGEKMCDKAINIDPSLQNLRQQRMQAGL